MILQKVREGRNALAIEVGRRRGLVFYVTATPAEVDLFSRSEKEFDELYSTHSTPHVFTTLLAAFAALRLPVSHAAAEQLRFAAGIAKKRAADWTGGELNSGERRKQPNLSHGRKPVKNQKNSVQPAGADVNSNLGHEAADSTASQHEHRESTMTAIKKSSKATAAKPSKAGGKAPAKTTETKAAAPKAEKPAKAAAKPPVEATEPGTKGRKRDSELYGAKVVATEKVAKEGSFYADLQAAAKKPIKLSDLIAKMEELHPDTADLKHHQKAAAKTVDGLKRMGYIALVA